ncbi:hypothetical protein CYMTET_3102 [Cymbomonas tetramitiformis]|uniref:Hydroxyproline O-arabinosyltransferase-like domain-containing protein n=1 Tax=Cymbomonas tetramitiformis TaxID=36881 RepID=A0AAE0H5S4_9CHLO|nr:hypothetical protein CYMTET_3102 [Cymbomonas tetramitiformis]
MEALKTNSGKSGEVQKEKVFAATTRAKVGTDSVDTTTSECSPDRKPFHVVLTSEGNSYQEWQTLIMYYHFKKQQATNPCTEMTGFTRVLSSQGGSPDSLMDIMPTYVAPSVGAHLHRGFRVINRPWSMWKFVTDPKFKEYVKEDYIYIAETDHLLLKDLPNKATPDIVVGFYFPYMEPVETRYDTVKRFWPEGDPKTLYPTGPSPTIMHVDILAKIAELWYQSSVDLKADSAADAVLGWALEMWGYTLACAKLGVKHHIWQQFQIEPASSWHQNVTVEDPYIYHYTFGVEYSVEGIAMIGQVGEWSLDKRRWTYGGFPPRNLSTPPPCAGECAHVLTALFNEATSKLPQWDTAATGTDTLMHRRGGGVAGEPAARGELGYQVATAGAWAIPDLGIDRLYFFKNGRATTTEGSASWTPVNSSALSLQICGRILGLTFNDALHPTSFVATSRGRSYEGKLVSVDGAPAGISVESSEPEPDSVVEAIIGSGPWAWSGTLPLAYLSGGILHTPWGPGKWGPVKPVEGDPTKDIFMEFVGSRHIITFGECSTFQSVRLGDGSIVKGWKQILPPQKACKI